MMNSLVVSARHLAYRWFSANNPEDSREEAWDFARDHWQEFLGNVESVPSNLTEFLASQQPEFLDDEDEVEVFQEEYEASGVLAGR